MALPRAKRQYNKVLHKKFKLPYRNIIRKMRLVEAIRRVLMVYVEIISYQKSPDKERVKRQIFLHEI